MLVVEYEGVEPQSFYHEGAHGAAMDYDPDFYYSESLAQPHGSHTQEIHQGELLDP